MGKTIRIHDTILHDETTTATAVDIVLSATSRRCDTPCPDAEAMAALAEGKLSQADRTALLEHIEACPECRAEWVLVASVPEQVQAKPAPRPAKATPFIPVAAALATVAACLVLMLQFGPMTSTLPMYAQQLEAGYSQLLHDPVMVAAANNLPPLSALSTRGESSPTAKSFALGRQHGATALRSGIATPASDATNRHLEYVYHLGRWSALLETAIAMQPAPERAFWTVQAQTAHAFALRGAVLYEETSTTLLMPLLADMEEQLQTIATAERHADLRRLGRQLNGLQATALTLEESDR